jgi:hypothetical protein
MAFGGSTVALLAVLSRHSHGSSFSSLAALLSLSFVGALVPAGVQLRSASLVADGRPRPRMTPLQTAATTVISLAVAPLPAFLLHVPVTAAALVSVQLVVAIPLSAKQGALMALHRFRKLGINLIIEGSARFIIGALAGRAFGVTGLAAGVTVGTTVALIVLRMPATEASRQDRPRTSLLDTSLTLALLGMYVQLDVLIAPSVLPRSGATIYDLAGVPAKGVYLVLLAAGPLIFPFVRRHRGGPKLVLGSALVTFAVGVVVTVALTAALPIIAVVLGQHRAGVVEFALLGLAMALAGVTAIITTAGVARGVKRPWPPAVVGIALLLLDWPLHPDVLQFTVAVLVSQTVTALLSVAIYLWGKVREPAPGENPLLEIESLAEAGDPLAPAQGMLELPRVERGASSLSRSVAETPGVTGTAFETTDSSGLVQRAEVVSRVADELGLPDLLGPACKERDIIYALILEQASEDRPARGDITPPTGSGAGEISGADIDAAKDWLGARQGIIEAALVRRHLSLDSSIPSVAQFGLSFTWVEGKRYEVAALGHSRQKKQGKVRVERGLVTDGDGRPLALELFDGNASDPTLFGLAVEATLRRLCLGRLLMVGERGITTARIAALRETANVDWLTGLREPQIAGLVDDDNELARRLREEDDPSEFSHPDYPGERLIAGRNSSRAQERATKRTALLTATEKALAPIIVSVREGRLGDTESVEAKVRKTLSKFKTARYFEVKIAENDVWPSRRDDAIEADAALDGIYVVRTMAPEGDFPKSRLVSAYEAFTHAARDYRHLTVDDIGAGPTPVHLEDRLRSHLFLCMLADYLVWHVPQTPAPMSPSGHAMYPAQGG